MAEKNYWEFLIENLDFIFIRKTVTVPAGQEVEIYKDVGRGLWFSGIVQSNVANVSIAWNIDGTDVGTNIQTIYNLGLTSPNNFYFYITKYDTTNNIYAMAWSPSLPVAFKQFCKVTLKNESTSDATITFLGYFVKVIK